MNGVNRLPVLLTRASIVSRERFAVSQTTRIMQCRRLLPSSLAGRSLSTTPPKLTATTRHRSFSSINEAEQESEIILYEKSPGNLAVAKSGFGFSCFHSIYWVWYAVDFVPTVNAAKMTQLHVDPMIPTVGIVFACIVQAIFTGYPLRLVSKLGWRPASREFTVYTHALPLVQPASTPSVHAVGDVRLDASSVEARRIATMGSDLKSFRGMLTIGKPGQWPPYLLDIRQSTEIAEPEILLELLLQPERLNQQDTGDAKSGPTRRVGTRKKSRGRRRK